MTEYSSNFYNEPNPVLIEKFEGMLKSRNSYFFDVEELEILIDFYLEKGIYHKARKAVNHGLELFPQSPSLMLKQAQTLLLGKKPKKAMKILNFLEAAEPLNTEMLLFKAVVHRNLSDFEGTKSCLLKVLSATSENREDIYLDLAFEQELIEDYHGAIQSLKKSLAINPNHEPSLFELGYCFDMADELENGITYFDKFLDESPYSFIGWYNLALCYEKLSFFEKAIEAVEYCLAIKDDFVNAHVLRANMYVSIDDDVKAIEAYSDSLVLDDQSAMVYAAIGECFERLGHWDLARNNYLEALNLDSKYTDALMGLGAIKEHEENYTESAVLYQEALRQDELNIDNWHVFAEMLVKAGKLVEAETAYLEVVANFEEDEEAWISLADVQAQNYGHQSAVMTLKSALEKLTTTQDITWHLVKHLFKAGKIEEGHELLGNALSEKPMGCKYFVNIFPESVLFPNIAALIELYTQAQSKNEF